MQLAVAVVGAAGTIISAYVVVRVRDVQRLVNGHTRQLEQEVARLSKLLADS